MFSERLMRSGFLLLTLILSGCMRPSWLETQIAESLRFEENREAFVSWDIPEALEARDFGIEVLCGTESRSYKYTFDAGRTTFFLLPPILTGVNRWYFTARSYCRDDPPARSGYANEVSKIVWE